MIMYNHIIVIALALLQLSCFISAGPVVITNNPAEQLDLTSTDLINQQLKDLQEHCSQPQQELLGVSNVLSGTYTGLLAGDYSDLREGNFEFTPSLVLVNRCDNTCKDVAGLNCKAVEEENVQQVMYLKDLQENYHKLRVNEHTQCKCTKTPKTQ